MKYYSTKSAKLWSPRLENRDPYSTFGELIRQSSPHGRIGKRYEDSSLSYTGINKHEGEDVGLYDTVLRRSDYEATFVNEPVEKYQSTGQKRLAG